MRQGSVVGRRFTIERLAGHGGMGAVYRARDAETGRAAAVKTLFDRAPEAIERFAREAALLASVRHPNVVGYLAHATPADDEAWLAMEWIEGESLEERLSSRGVTSDEAIAIVRQAAEALGAAHARGVVHRDIKPSNLMLVGGDPARVKLLDFGIARAAWGAALTASGAVLGSAFYMSPEQARAERAVDARADVFSLGCVLFRALTGRLPFDGPTPAAVLLRIVLDEAPSLAELRPDLPAALAALVARLLAKPREDRLADGAAVAAALAALGPVDDTLNDPRARVGGARAATGLALTATERRVASLVLARPGASEETTEDGTVLLPQGDADLRAAIARHGGALDVLADGTLVVATRASGGATDLAEAAARCALAVRGLSRVDAVAVAFGEHEVTGRTTMAALIDVGLDLLDAPTPYVRLDPRLARLLQTRFDVGKDALGLVLRGDRDAASGPGLTLLGRAMPCVGREAELAMLDALVAQAFDEPAATAALVLAPTGIGKSRLARELLARMISRAEPPNVWALRGDVLRAGSPFGLLAPLLQQQAGIAQKDGPEACEAKLAARVARHVPAVEAPRVAEFLAALASIPLASPPSAELAAARDDPRRFAEGIRRAFTAYVRAEAKARPLAILVEDLHWGDQPTVMAIDAVLGELAGAPIFVLALGRPETTDAFPRLWESRRVQTLTLRELRRRAAERLVRAALGDDAPVATVARVVDRAAGNAFFLEELVRAEASGAGAALPETVLATVEARLAGLDSEARRVLRAASVFGESFWPGGLRALLGEGGAATPSPSQAVEAWLAALEQGEFVAPRAESRFPSEPELVFRHALVREAAYAMLTDADRALGHRLAGAWLEARGERDLALLASHFERGGEPERAARHHVGAARIALGAGDLATALASARRAVASGASGPLLGAARLVELETLRYTDSPAVVDAADEAVALLPAGTDEFFRAVGLRVSVYLNAGRHLDAAETFASATAPVVPGAERARAVYAGRVVIQFIYAGHGALAERLIAELRDVDVDDFDPLARALTARAFGVYARAFGHVQEQLVQFTRARRFFELSGDPQGCAIVATDIAMLRADLGMYEEAEAEAKGLLALGAAADLQFFVAAGHLCHGRALAGLGRLAEARAALEEGLRLAAAVPTAAVVAGFAKFYLALVLLELRDWDGADRAAREAIALHERMVVVVAGPLAVLARVALARGKVDDAVDAARRGVARSATGSFSAPLARLALAESVFAAGHLDEARAVLADARDRLRAEAAAITDEHAREAYLRRVPENARTLALASAWIDA